MPALLQLLVGGLFILSPLTAADPTPGPRYGHELVYEEAREVTILFGGFGEDGKPSAETWSFDGNAWELVAEEGPSPRRWPAMAYDHKRARLILHGGREGTGRSGARSPTPGLGTERDGHGSPLTAPRVEITIAWRTTAAGIESSSSAVGMARRSSATRGSRTAQGGRSAFPTGLPRARRSGSLTTKRGPRSFFSAAAVDEHRAELLFRHKLLTLLRDRGLIFQDDMTDVRLDFR